MIDKNVNFTEGTLFIVTELTSGTLYKFQIASINIIGVSAFSSVLEITTLTNATVPASPTALTRVDLNTNATQVALSWTPPTSDGGSPITGYQIYWDAGTTGGPMVV